MYTCCHILMHMITKIFQHGKCTKWKQIFLIVFFSLLHAFCTFLNWEYRAHKFFFSPSMLTFLKITIGLLFVTNPLEYFRLCVWNSDKTYASQLKFDTKTSVRATLCLQSFDVWQPSTDHAKCMSICAHTGTHFRVHVRAQSIVTIQIQCLRRVAYLPGNFLSRLRIYRYWNCSFVSHLTFYFRNCFHNSYMYFRLYCLIMGLMRLCLTKMEWNFSLNLGC